MVKKEVFFERVVAKHGPYHVVTIPQSMGPMFRGKKVRVTLLED